MRLQHLLFAAGAVLLVGCAGVVGDRGADERTVLVDYDHDQVASSFMAYFPSHVEVHAGDEVLFRQQWTGEGHSVTMGTYVDDALEIGRPLMEQYPDEEPPPDIVAPFYEIYERLPLMINEELEVNQNGAQPCYLDAGLPPPEPDTPCAAAQQRQPEFNGRQSYYNSGFIPYEGRGGNEYRVRLADDIRPGTYSYYCNLHGFFQNGTIEVVPPDEDIPTQAQVSREAYAQIKETAAPLLRAYRKAVATEGETEIVGLTVRKPFAGWFPETEETPAWINEFVPKRTEITTGQALTWSFVGGHTVSFDVPAYFSEFVVEPDGTVEWTRDAVAPRGRRLVTNDPSQPPQPSEPPAAPPSEQARAGTEAPAADASSEQPTGAAAGDQDAESSEDDRLPVQHVDAGRWDGNGFLSSGVQGNGTYTVTFTRPGTYPYACLIHPRMVGEVVVR